MTLRARLKALAPGLTPRAVFEKMSNVQMQDVEFPTTGGRVLTLPRHTEPDPEVTLLLERLKLSIPPQSKPRITATQNRDVVETFAPDSPKLLGNQRGVGLSCESRVGVHGGVPSHRIP